MAQDRRNSLLAAALGFLIPGLGHLYIGRAKRFGVPALGIIALILALGLTGALSTFIGFAIYIIAFVALYLFAIVDPPLQARHHQFHPKWYNHWYGYLGWIAIPIIFSAALPVVRESLLGYSTFRVPTAAMSPTIEPKEIILVNTHAFQARFPSAGDVVVVRGPQTGRLFIRRISKVNGTSFAFANDNPQAIGNVAELDAASRDEIVGRVTYVLYSDTSMRIGRQVE
jgi:signal peptidase I